VHPAQSQLFGFLAELGTNWHAWNRAGLGVGLTALAALYVLSRVRYVPGGLVVILLGIAATRALDLPGYGVATVGPIHFDLQAPGAPSLTWPEWLRLGELGMAMVMILYSESYGSIRNFALKHGETVSANRDLVALGVANLVAGLFHGTPVGAGYSATSANEAAGARSRWAARYAALVLLILLLTMLPAIALTPEPVLAAIVIHAVSHSLNPAVFRPYFAWHRDRIVAVAAVLAVLWLGVLDGLLAAIAVSLMMMLRRFSETTVSELGRLGQGHDFVSIAGHPEAARIPGILILRPEEPLFFANVERILGQARRKIAGAGPSLAGVVLSLEDSFDLDSTSAEALAAFCTWVSERGPRLVLARVKPPVEDLLARVEASGSGARALSGLSVDDAVAIVTDAGAADLPDSAGP